MDLYIHTHTNTAAFIAQGGTSSLITPPPLSHTRARAHTHTHKHTRARAHTHTHTKHTPGMSKPCPFRKWGAASVCIASRHRGGCNTGPRTRSRVRDRLGAIPPYTSPSGGILSIPAAPAPGGRHELAAVTARERDKM